MYNYALRFNVNSSISNKAILLLENTPHCDFKCSAKLNVQMQLYIIGWDIKKTNSYHVCKVDDRLLPSHYSQTFQNQDSFFWPEMENLGCR
jgi:hypothetical protein